MTLNHPIFTRWPAQNPHRLQLFSLPTPNGVKVGIMLEETRLAYEPWFSNRQNVARFAGDEAL